MPTEPTLAELAKKLDTIEGFFKRLEAAFAPPIPEPEPKELEAVQKAMEEAAGEMPSPDDMLLWSTPGPLPSEIAKAEAEPEDA